MGLIWGRQDPGGPYVDPMKLDIWAYSLETGPIVISFNEIDFLYLRTIIVWLPCNVWFIKNRTLHKYISPVIEDILS